MFETDWERTHKNGKKRESERGKSREGGRETD